MVVGISVWRKISWRGSDPDGSESAGCLGHEVHTLQLSLAPVRERGRRPWSVTGSWSAEQASRVSPEPQLPSSTGPSHFRLSQTPKATLFTSCSVLFHITALMLFLDYNITVTRGDETKITRGDVKKVLRIFHDNRSRPAIHRQSSSGRTSFPNVWGGNNNKYHKTGGRQLKMPLDGWMDGWISKWRQTDTWALEYHPCTACIWPGFSQTKYHTDEGTNVYDSNKAGEQMYAQQSCGRRLKQVQVSPKACV